MTAPLTRGAILKIKLTPGRYNELPCGMKATGRRGRRPLRTRGDGAIGLYDTAAPSDEGAVERSETEGEKTKIGAKKRPVGIGRRGRQITGRRGRRPLLPLSHFARLNDSSPDKGSHRRIASPTITQFLSLPCVKGGGKIADFDGGIVNTAKLRWLRSPGLL